MLFRGILNSRDAQAERCPVDERRSSQRQVSIQTVTLVVFGLCDFHAANNEWSRLNTGSAGKESPRG